MVYSRQVNARLIQNRQILLNLLLHIFLLFVRPHVPAREALERVIVTFRATFTKTRSRLRKHPLLKYNITETHIVSH